jgi:hypothetical protein
MKKRSVSLIFCLMLALPALSVLAQDSGDLFVAETGVADEGSETRNTALSQLLAIVLGRVSGNTGIGGQPAARDLLAAAPSLVQEYRYRTDDLDGKLVRYLWARFDQSAVERMMRERNLPVWVQRPRVLLWVATERGGKRVLLNLENEPQARVAVVDRARQVGMPLQLPLMDLEDQTKLTPADLWSDYQSGIRLASARYPHQFVLAGRLSAQRGAKWSGAWSLIGRDDSQSFQAPAQGLDDALAFAIDQAQKLLAARYAPMPGVAGSSGTLVHFADVYDLAAYGRLVALLGGLEPVSQVALRHVDQDSFLFELQVRGGQEDLARALEAGGQVVSEPPPLRRLPYAPAAGTGTPDLAPVTVAPEADLYYRLLN